MGREEGASEKDDFASPPSPSLADFNSKGYVFTSPFFVMRLSILHSKIFAYPCALPFRFKCLPSKK